MDGGEWYSEEQHKKWCSGQEVRNKKNNQDFATSEWWLQSATQRATSSDILLVN